MSSKKNKKEKEKTSAIKKNKLVIRNLALSGGGLKGVAFLGAVKALQELEIFEPRRIAGTSIGAFYGLLIVLDFNHDELYSFVTNFDYGSIKSYDFINCFKNWGIDTGERVVQFTRHLLKRKLQKFDCTFKELYQYNPIELTITSTHLNSHSVVYYNYKTHPDESVIDAIRQSISIPGLLCPVKKNNGDVFVDGGLLDNFPIQVLPDSNQTLGIYFVDEDNKKNENPRYEINELEGFIGHLFTSVMNYNLKEKIKTIKRAHVIKVCQRDINVFNLYITTEQKVSLYNCGYHDTLEYFRKL